MAKTRLDDFSEKVRTAKLTKVVDQDIHARFDVVVSINAIHTMEEPSEAISALGETLAADGRAFIVDPTEFAPSAMVTAAIAQCAFGDGEPSGLLSPEKWIDSLSEKGLRADWVKIDDGLFISLSSRTSPPIDLTLLRSTLEKKFPHIWFPSILESYLLSRYPETEKWIKEALKTGLNCIALSVMHLTIILSQMEKSRKRFRLYGQNSLEDGVSAATMDFLNTEETA